jgi:hypothetical protein
MDSENSKNPKSALYNFSKETQTTTDASNDEADTVLILNEVKKRISKS